jgi:ketosteroid isomerase-like protein
MTVRSSLSLIALLMLAGCTKAAPDAKETERSLRAANAAYDQALIDGDAAQLDRYYADDFSIIDDDAAIHDKKNQIAFMTKEVDLLNARNDDVRVTLLGPDAALLTGRFSGRYKYRGKESDFTERFTSVWVRENGHWRVKHEHASLKPQESAPSATTG